MEKEIHRTPTSDGDDNLGTVYMPYIPRTTINQSRRSEREQVKNNWKRGEARTYTCTCEVDAWQEGDGGKDRIPASRTSPSDPRNPQPRPVGNEQSTTGSVGAGNHDSSTPMNRTETILVRDSGSVGGVST